MNNQRPWYCSWGIIILAFICFWPAGIALLVVRNNAINRTSRQSLFKNMNRKTYITIGAILIFVGLMMMSESAMMGLFLFAGGIALIVYSKKLAHDTARRKKYIDLIVNNQVYSMEKIASICNVQYPVALKEVNQLISLGVLKGAYVDESKRQVVMPMNQNIAGNITTTQSMGNGFVSVTQTINGGIAAQPPKMVAAVCPGCGAKMTIQEGSVVECEYCAAAVSAQ